MVKDGKWGVIDRAGRVVIPMQGAWDQVWDFSNGLALVVKNRLGGFIDRTGKIVIPLQWNYATPFDDGLAQVVEYLEPVKDDESVPARMCYIDTIGKVIWSSDGQGVGGYGPVGK